MISRLLLTLLLLFCGLQARVADVDVLPSFSQGSLNQDQRNLGLYLSQLSSVLSASALNQDPETALASGAIAAQENAFFVPLILVGLSAYEAYDLYQTYQRDGAEAALTQAGISIGLAASGGVVVKYGGKLGSKVITKVYPNLHQAWLGLVESNPILSKVIAVADGGIKAIKQLDSQASQKLSKLWSKAGGKGVGGGVGKGVEVAERQVIAGVKVSSEQTMGGVRNLDPRNAAAHQKYREHLAKLMEKPRVSDPKLKVMVDWLYRDGAKVGNGSTAAAVRKELRSGVSIGDKLHSQKAHDSLRFLEKWQRAHPNASFHDRSIAELIAKDLKNALRGDI